MRNAWKLGLGQIQALIEATQEVRFAREGRAEVYEWISRTLEQQQCRERRKRRRGGTAARGENDGAEPDAGDAAGGAVRGARRRKGSGLPAAPFREPLHTGRQDRGIVIFAAQKLSVIAPTVVRGPGEPFLSRFSKRQPNRCDFSRPGYDSRAA